MPTAIVQVLPPEEVNFGHCYSNVAGLAAGEPIRLSVGRPPNGPTERDDFAGSTEPSANGSADGEATIYCRLAWDLERRVRDAGRVALDSRQCAALDVRDGSQVVVEGLRGADLPEADFVELRLTRWSGPPTDHSVGLPDFLQANRYLLYRGLRFGYQPLGGTGTGEYQVTAVMVGGRTVAVARASAGFAYFVRPDHGIADWPPMYHEIGGLRPVIDVLRREIELPLRRARDLATVGIQAPAGILLYGPPGTGKTMLARAIAHQSGARVTFLSGPELASQPPPERESALRSAFTPDEPGEGRSLVIIDDLDFVAPNRDGPAGATQLLGLLQRLLDAPGRPVVVATTNKRDAIDPAIRRLGRVGRHIRVHAPSENDRKAILEIQARWLPLETQEPERGELLTDLARRTAGFVGADLEALCQEAGCLALRRAFPLDVLESDHPEAKVPLQIRASDWAEALTLVTPSAIDSDVSDDVPPTTFDDVAGLPETVTALKERLVYPLRRPEVFAAADLRMERGVLLYGPTGTGKTLLARAVAHECDCRFMAVRGSELLTKWFGESEQAVRDLFDRARSVAPCVVFFDEIDAIARRRTGGAHDSGASDRVVNQLLAEIDGLIDLGQVSIIGATNNRDIIDPALLRPGRLGLQIEVPLPDADGRRELFEMYLPETLHALCAQWGAVASRMSGADIAMVAREARLNALRRVNFEEAVPVTAEDVTAALEVRLGALRGS